MTIVAFQPSTQTAFQFQATLDGQNYAITVTWNLFGERYYINIYDLAQTLIASLPLIGSPTGRDISLIAGYFTSTMVFRQGTQQFEISP